MGKEKQVTMVKISKMKMGYNLLDLFAYSYFFASTFNPYKVIEERLWKAYRQTGADTIIDLCSGAAKPVLTVRDELNKMHRFVPVVISDKFPNRRAFREIEKDYNGRVRPVYDPVDATDVPPELNGFRTIFFAFHHFDWEPAQSIIKDAAVKRQGIGIFEYTDRSLLHYFHNLSAAIFVLLIEILGQVPNRELSKMRMRR